MDMLKKRPVMPGTTQAPPPLGKTSVYQGTKKPHFTEEFLNQKRIREEELAMARSQGVDEATLQVGNVPNTTYYSTEVRKRQQRAVNKAISQLPYTTREQVETFVGMALNTAEATSKELETTRREINQLRKELNSKSQDLDLVKRNNMSLKQKLTTAESNIDVMKEEVQSKQAFHLRNKHILEKVSNTNRLLIGSIEAMGGDVAVNAPTLTRNDSARSDQGNRTLLKPIEGAPQQHDSSYDLSAIIRPSSSQEILNSRPTTAEEHERLGTAKKSKKLADAPGDDSGLDKLKESLLRVTRQHLISQTANVNLDKEVLSLRGEIKQLETANRLIKNELDELKSVKSADSPVSFTPNIAVAEGEEAEDERGDDGRAREGKRVRQKNFGKIDQRFDALLKRDALDPWTGFMTIRRILEFGSNAPSSSATSELAAYAVGSSLNKIFDTDGVALFLKPSINDFEQDKGVLYKYTARSPDPEEIGASEYGRSVAWKSLRTGHSQRLNSLTRNATYNKNIDGIKGLVARRLLCTPIFNLITGDPLGCLMLVNKQSSGDAFLEADELLMLVVCDQFSALFTQSLVMEKTLKSMNVYKNTLECSVAPFDLIGKRGDGEAAHGVVKGSRSPVSVSDIITCVERCCTKALNCTRAKVFLATSHIRDTEPGNLLFLDHSARNRTSERNSGDVTLTSPVSGIAGQVYTTRETIEIGVQDSELKSRLNPLADLDVTNKPMVVTPILDSQGEVIAVLELMPSNRSPHMAIAEGISTPSTIGNKIIFSQAAQWVAYSISPSLQHMLFYVDRPPAMPAWFPLQYSALQITPFDVSQVADVGGSGDDLGSVGSVSTEGVDGLEDIVAPLLDARKYAQDTLTRRKSSVTTIQIQREQEAAIASLSRAVEERSALAHSLQVSLDSRDADMAAARKVIEDDSAKKIGAATAARQKAERETATVQQALEEAKVEAEAQATALRQQMDETVQRLQSQLDSVRASTATAALDSHEVDDGSTPAPAHAPVDEEGDPRFATLKSQVDTLKREQQQMSKKAAEAEASVAAANKKADEALSTVATTEATYSAEKAQTEASLASLRSEISSLETQLKQASDRQGALQTAQKLNKQLSSDLEKARADLVQKEMTVSQLTEQLVKMANENLDKSVASVQSGASAIATNAALDVPPVQDITIQAPTLSLSASTKNALGMEDVGGGEANPEGSIDTMGSEGLDEINALLATAALGTDEGEKPSGSAPGSRPLSARPPSTPPGAQSRPKTGESATHTHVEGDALPAPWERHTDEHGNVYYHNPESGETSWEIPQHSVEGFTESTEAYVGITLGDEYTQMFDTDGNEYFVNHATGESVWGADLPEDVCEKYKDVLSHRPASSSVHAAAATA
jgi:hypothetical protein